MALFNTHHDKSLTFRGFILHETVEIERLMDDCISLFFCKEKSKAEYLKELIFYTERINFDYKRQILSVIISDNYNSFLLNRVFFTKYLEDIAPIRNVFAHLELMPKEKENDDLVFKKYVKGKLSERRYTNIELAKIEQNMYYCLDSLNELKRLISPPK